MGDFRRIPKCADKKHSDPEFERLLSINPNRLSHNLSPFFTNPVYRFTSAAVGGIGNDVSNLR